MSDEKPEPQSEKFTDREVVVGDTRVNMKVIIGVLVLVAVLLFIFQNTDQIVTLQWTFFDFDMVLWAYTILMVVLGMLLGWGLNVRRTRKKAAAQADKKKK